MNKYIAYYIKIDPDVVRELIDYITAKEKYDEVHELVVSIQGVDYPMSLDEFAMRIRMPLNEIC